MDLLSCTDRNSAQHFKQHLKLLCLLRMLSNMSIATCCGSWFCAWLREAKGIVDSPDDHGNYAADLARETSAVLDHCLAAPDLDVLGPLRTPHQRYAVKAALAPKPKKAAAPRKAPAKKPSAAKAKNPSAGSSGAVVEVEACKS